MNDNIFVVVVDIDASKPDKQSVFALLLAEALCKKHHVKVRQCYVYV